MYPWWKSLSGSCKGILEKSCHRIVWYLFRFFSRTAKYIVSLWWNASSEWSLGTLVRINNWNAKPRRGVILEWTYVHLGVCHLWSRWVSRKSVQQTLGSTLQPTWLKIWPTYSVAIGTKTSLAVAKLWPDFTQVLISRWQMWLKFRPKLKSCNCITELAQWPWL